MFFDAVLHRGQSMFNGTEIETKKWIRNHLEEIVQFEDEIVICVGKTLELLTIDQYMSRK